MDCNKGEISRVHISFFAHKQFINLAVFNLALEHMQILSVLFTDTQKNTMQWASVSVQVGGRQWELGPHPQTQGQLVHLDLSVIVDITVAQEDCPELVQLWTTDAGLVEEQAQTPPSLYKQ